MTPKPGVEPWIDNWRFPYPRSTTVTTNQTTPYSGATEPVDLYPDDLMGLTGDGILEGSIIMLINVVLLTTNLTTIIVMLTGDGVLYDVIGSYFLSLSLSDIVLSVALLPIAFYASIQPNWRFMMPNVGGLCQLEAYLGIMLITLNACMMMLISLDRFAAVKKPGRYEVEQTFTRSKCWILFSWISALLICCPTIFTDMAQYYPEVKLCMNDWSQMAAYSVILATLVILPSMLSVGYSYGYIMRQMQNGERLQQAQQFVLDNDANVLVGFVIIAVFAISWLPWFCLRFYETLHGSVPSGPLRFCLVWLGISSGCWRLLIHTLMNPQFRRRLKRLFTRSDYELA